jgi:arsenate reductase (thioredoxin)
MPCDNLWRAEAIREVDAVTNVLFVCIGNQGRSVIAERLFRAAAHGAHDARSAGAAPGAEVHDVAVAALAEVGIDASDHVPRKLDDELIAWADVVIAACDGACPVVPGKRYDNWRLPDPMGRPLAEVRVIRDDIGRRVDTLLDELTASA